MIKKSQMFNLSPSAWMHIDLNSCFATIEQQANPLLRNKPIAVAAYTTPRGCILAPSIEAKRYGVKTGMQVQEGKQLCPRLIILPSDPAKYRFVNRALLKLFQQYSPFVTVRSIDEMLIDFSDLFIANEVRNPRNYAQITSLIKIGQEIKSRIKKEIGEWLTVSIGISTNPYLAKFAAGLHKPDGLDEINAVNIQQILAKHSLVELPYIKEKNQIRLLCTGVRTPLDFYNASLQQLKAAFRSINGYYWYLRLHGFRIDEVEWQRRSIGHSYALPKATDNLQEVEQLLYKLVEKMGRRLRSNHLTAQGIHLACNFVDGSFWHHGQSTSIRMYASSDLFSKACHVLTNIQPLKPVRILAVSCFALQQDLYNQQTLFANEEKKRSLVQALDEINDHWGEFSVMPAAMLTVQKQNKILDRIAFGRVLDMQDVILQSENKWERELYIE